MMKLIDKWQDKKYRCTLCNTDKSVKYESTISGITVHLCNRCSLITLALDEKLGGRNNE